MNPNLECLLIQFETFVNDFCERNKPKVMCEVDMLRMIARNVPVKRIGGDYDVKRNQAEV